MVEFNTQDSVRRLALWGRHLFNVWPRDTLLKLPLEELFLWDPSDVDALSVAIQESRSISRKPLHNTLRKIGSRIFWGEEVIKAFPQLTHILVLKRPDERVTNIISLLLLKESMKCCIFYSWKGGQTKSSVLPNGRELAEGLRDRRLVHMRLKLNHLDFRNADSNLDFWGEHAEMWRKAEIAVAENINSKTVTVVGAFSENF
ncbi:hypothetical protein DL96DRAFT_1824094 [Flagelloscypha sp. PMI_526]|nr:hypothetical protein DL96DRAFT_1824094 [Flagelloscypha sp. PMI_526]